MKTDKKMNAIIKGNVNYLKAAEKLPYEQGNVTPTLGGVQMQNMLSQLPVIIQQQQPKLPMLPQQQQFPMLPQQQQFTMVPQQQQFPMVPQQQQFPMVPQQQQFTMIPQQPQFQMMPQQQLFPIMPVQQQIPMIASQGYNMPMQPMALQFPALPAETSVDKEHITQPNSQRIKVKATLNSSEKEIIKELETRDPIKIIQLLTNYKVGNRQFFLRKYLHEGEPLVKYIDSHLTTNYKPMIIGDLLGSSYYDSYLISMALDKDMKQVMMTVLCVVKLIKKKFPDDTFLKCFSISTKEALASWNNTDADIYKDIYISPRRKKDRFDKDSISKDIETIFMWVDRKELDSLFKAFLTYSKLRIKDISVAYYYTFGVTIYEHAAKKGLNPLLLDFLRNLIPLCVEINYYYAYMLYGAFFSKEFDILIPYLISIISFLSKEDILPAFRKLSGKSLDESIKERFPDVVASYLCDRAK